jgi:hypothetical protein
MMKAGARTTRVLGALSLALLLAGAAEPLGAQAQPTVAQTGPQGAAQSTAQPAAPGTPENAEQKYKNIQVLKGIPADQLIPSMQFMAASLGVECEFCHVHQDPGSDGKQPKLVARKMMTMMMQINTDNFKGERVVTCYSCHRGAARPVGTPILSA